VLIEGVFHPERFLDLVRHFVTFENDRGRIVKKLAGYHQFHAVRRAVKETVRASRSKGDRRIGVVWHTQGSGKSLTMVFYAGKLVANPAMENPTIVVLTDRNDLDDQLFATFSQSQSLLRQKPIQAEDRAHLRELLNTAAGGVYFTTVQKFLPEEGEKYPALSERRNIVVIADEAHRSQYGFKGRVDAKTGEMIYGFAKHLRDALPKASFIGFTGTPIELEDKNTVQVFGNYISIYDIRQAVEDHATVPIYYENRLAKLDLDERERPRIDPAFEEITEGEEESRKEALKSEWSTLEALIGTEKRIAVVARDIVEHFEKRIATMDGKGMIVCMSRRICVALHDAIVKLRPTWFGEDDDEGAIKIVMTGSASDKPELQPHVRTKARRERLADRFKDPKDPLKLVIVRDMWLTGFDAPCLHTLYVDKPMRSHNLMQAIARVNRVYGDKPGGLIVDYIGIASFLKEAMNTYARSGGRGDATNAQEKAVAVMLEKLEICRDVFHGFDYEGFFEGDPKKRLALLPAAREFVLTKRKPKTADENESKASTTSKKKPSWKPKTFSTPDEYDLFMSTVGDLSKAFALAAPHDTCEEIRDEVAFFQAVKVGLVKLATGRRPPSEDLGHAVRQIVANAVVTDDVIDVFAAAGLPKPDISILSQEFLAEVEGMKHKNLAAELLKRLLEDEIRTRGRLNLVQARKFSELLERSISRYQSRTIETVEVIQELIEIAKQMQSAGAKAASLKLSKAEGAFYDALANNQSAVDVMGDEQLAAIARELTTLVQKNASIDWVSRRNVQARLRAMVKRVLREKGYPPDEAQAATDLVLEQAKQLGINLVEGGSDASVAPLPMETPTVPVGIAPKQMPYPIAVFDTLIGSQDTPFLRVKTRIDAIERALAFVVGIEIALLRESGGGTLGTKARAVFGKDLGKPISMGTWLEYAWRLAALLPDASEAPEVRAVHAFVDDLGKPSELTKHLQTEIVPYRNTYTHGVTATEEQVAEREPAVHESWKRVKDALAPLADVTVVSYAKIIEARQSGVHRYSVRVHRGDSSIFVLDERDVAGAMEKEWCYLVRDGRAPLLLAPVMFCRAEKDWTREIFVARTLQIEPGSKVDAMGLVTDHKTTILVPGTASTIATPRSHL
jgi:type I restriction enzyme R subunit